MANALRPTWPTKTTNPADPLNVRTFQAIDANETSSVFHDHADKIDALLAALGLDTGSDSIGRFATLSILQAAYPDGANGSYAIIDDGLGGSLQVAEYNETTNLWVVSSGDSPIIFLTNLASRPDIGAENTMYLVKENSTIYYYDSEWKIAGGTPSSSSTTISEFNTNADVASQVFTLNNASTVIQVLNNGISIRAFEWSQSGSSLTVSPVNGGLFADGYIQVIQQ
ncbi:hypothetical protein M1M27_gp30 [Cellulophaga phage Ingeline_1]|uniref:Uncharacterized protein n=1 Tax=Cellulophaga phage Ingeline_1 TaxID=2745674 RepID=A0A8E4ZKF2_9CAUD|nr:hypothetical protein M1M27_gp30 [Cellulophaga phage Ingeline_1]QQV90008.1 hypothetical protein Ingeline2_21 [Cellulophaga phage Ingeline_2]QQV90058.1 hypothetical protein Ingeline3_21 [Cellulophaga phage Ingeline_3]QQV90108.1 hypothetical protein Ingeline4_21 [Cellulophaga phage Ingeline_4]QQV90158.1 hypothetical protein Ingeline5_21 [Cellulophaga phage Ingeline_5]QQV90207.1 hypothetical protein Ingeline6_21 [Cellulophaga phage Ingeline_6]QQV90257.1 hypothetical protein Ingeline7_21 [Cellu